MNKFISIRNITVPEKVQNDIIAMPDNLRIGCRLCSDGLIITLFDEKNDKLYGIAVDVKEAFYPICYGLEDTDAARALEKALLNIFIAELNDFLKSEESIFNTEDGKELLELHTDYFLCHAKHVLIDKPNEMCIKVAHRCKSRRHNRKHNHKSQN